MADENKPPTFVTIDGVDVSQFVDCVDRVNIRDDELLKGLQSRGPITLSGLWDATDICLVCRQPFTPGPEGKAVLTETHSGDVLGVVCSACGTSLIAPRDDT